jgi:hypothetical protein
MYTLRERALPFLNRGPWIESRSIRSMAGADTRAPAVLADRSRAYLRLAHSPRSAASASAQRQNHSSTPSEKTLKVVSAAWRSGELPLLEAVGVAAFIRREVLPYTPDAWAKPEATKIGFEVSFTRHFYKPQPLRMLDEIRADILAIEEEAGGLLDEIIGGHAPVFRGLP